MNFPNGGGAAGGRPHYILRITFSASIKALASASIKSIGHPLVLNALAIHLFQMPSELKAAMYLDLV